MLPSESRSLNGKSVLITGGSGAFGQAFVAHLLATYPLIRRILVFSRSESNQAMMRTRFPETGPLRYVLGDVTDYLRLLRAFDGVDVVIHAAAMKRVPECQQATMLATDVNVNGTENVVRAACEQGVERTVFLSTDKAAAPLTAYGKTKALAEDIVQEGNVMGAGRQSRFASTRYGNVQGSTGSVIPIWRGQKARGEPFTLTDTRMTRFWMSMGQAVQLVQTALDTMQGGEVFVPKLPAIRIADLCAALDDRWPVKETGIRMVEKLHEDLISRDEARQTWDRGSHYVIEPTSRPWDDTPRSPVGVKVAEDWTYSSETCRRLSMGELKAMVEGETPAKRMAA